MLGQNDDYVGDTQQERWRKCWRVHGFRITPINGSEKLCSKFTLVKKKRLLFFNFPFW